MNHGNRPLSTRSASMSDREKELREWCAEHDYDPDDRLAPHVQAFLGGHSYGYENGYDDGWKAAASDE